MEVKKPKEKLQSIKKYFDADPTLQSIQIPISYDNKRIVVYRNKYCKKPECIYDSIQVQRRLKGQVGQTRIMIQTNDEQIFWCNICRNTIDPKEFLQDEELQRIVDNVWGQIDDLAKMSNVKVDCKKAVLFRDGTWEPVFTQIVKGRLMRKTQTAINKAQILPSLEDRNDKEFSELYDKYLGDSVPKGQKYDELVSISLFPHPIRPDQGRREVTAYFKLSMIQALVKQYKLQIIHGPTFRMRVGKDMMRTFVKYLENQGLTTKKTGRRYYAIGFEGMKNEQNSKVEKYKYFFFDKEELIESYRMKDYDDLLLIFKFGESWYASIWQVSENELHLIDFKAGEPESTASAAMLIKEFHKKFFDFQTPSKGVVILPDNNSYRVTNKRDDDCGDLCMAFLYLYSIGSLLIEIKITPPKRANFSVAFAWLLLKIYHEEEYNFRRNIMTPTPKRTETRINTKESQATQKVSIEVDGEESRKDEEDSQDDPQHEFDFADIIKGGISQLPRHSGFKQQVRYTPMPKKEDIPPSSAEKEENKEDEQYRKKVVEIGSTSRKPTFKSISSKIQNSGDLDSYEFEASHHSDNSYLKKAAFNQQERRTGNSRMNVDQFPQQNEWDILQDDGAFKKKLGAGSVIPANLKLVNQPQLGNSNIFIQEPKSTKTIQSQQQQQLQPSNFFQNVGQKALNSDSQIILKKDQIGKEELDKMRQTVNAQLQQLGGQFVKKEDIIDILTDIQREVNFEMKLQMRKLGEEIKFEREKKEVEKELKQSHFQEHFQYLLDYYYQYDKPQYYQLLQEYNQRVRSMAVNDQIQSSLPQLGSISNSTALPVSFGSIPTGYISSPMGQSSFANVSQIVPSKLQNSPSTNLPDGFFNRGTMKYAAGDRYTNQNVFNKDGPNIEQKYLSLDNNFKNNMKIPREAKFATPGVNGFAIPPQHAQKYIERTNKYLEDSQAIGQQLFDERKAQMVQRLKNEQIMKSMEKFSGGQSSIKLFGKKGNDDTETITTQIDQERKYQQLVKDQKQRGIEDRMMQRSRALQSQQNTQSSNSTAKKDEEYGSNLRMLVPMIDISKKNKTQLLIDDEREGTLHK